MNWKRTRLGSCRNMGLVLLAMAWSAPLGNGQELKEPAPLPVSAQPIPTLPNAGRAEPADAQDLGSGASTFDTSIALASADAPQSPSTASQIAAAPDIVSDAAVALTSEAVQARREEVEKRSDLDDATKAQILKSYDRALDLLVQNADLLQKLAKIKTEREVAPATINELKTELEQPAPSSEPLYDPQTSVAELERLRLEDQVRLDEAKKNLDQWEARAKTRTERRPQMPALIEATRKQLEEVKKSLSLPAPDGESPLLTGARRTELEAQVIQLESQSELFRNEQLRYEALNESFPLQRDLLTRNRNALERLAERWQEVLAQARLQESERHRREAWQNLENAHPDLRGLAERNAELTQLRQAHLQLREKWKNQQTAVNDKLAVVSKNFDDIQEKVNRVGLTTAIGLMLRKQQIQLPNKGSYERIKSDAEQEFVRLQMEQLQLDDERKSLDDIEARVDQIVASIDQEDLPADELRKMSRELLVSQRSYLEALLSDYDSSLSTLVEIEFSCRQLVKVVGEFDAYIGERVLWIRSVAPVQLDFATSMMHSVLSLTKESDWNELPQLMTTDATSQPLLYVGLLMLLLVVKVVGWRTKQLIRIWRNSTAIQLQSGVSQALTAVAISTVAAGFWPALLGFFSWRLSRFDLPVTQACSDGLQLSATLFWLLNSIRWMCRRDGVAQSFWKWPESAVHALRSNLGIYITLGIPLVFVVVASQRLDQSGSAETIGRLSFVLFCGVVTVFLLRVLRPRGSVVCTLLTASTESVIYRTRWIWYPIAVCAPIAIAGLALLGYQYTAQQLMFRLELTLGLLIILALTYAVMKQWLIAARRQLAMKQARARRSAERAAMQASGSDSTPLVDPLPLDLTLINQQVLRWVQGTLAILFLVGSWAVWDQVFPALQVFGRVEMWSTVVTASEVVETAQGPQLQEVSRVQPVTRADLLVAIVVVTLTWLSTRNLPGLLELSILPKLPLDHGSRNAIKIVSGYAMLVTGLVIASNMVGLQWSNVQWLVAALTVGLGFGLQEIFANFVSGLIILFERPVRVGDIVTIDSVSGVVSRIQIRATTITDWDRKEFIVPNKEFVTGRLLNWTLSDKTNRVKINVGIGYESDVQQALQILTQVAEENAVVLKEPPPNASFEGFGDSTLNLVLRVFLPNLENRLQVITDLHLQINHRFQEAGIEISYPQRDLHIRSVTPNLAATLEQAAQANGRTDHRSWQSGPGDRRSMLLRVVGNEEVAEMAHSEPQHALEDPAAATCDVPAAPSTIPASTIGELEDVVANNPLQLGAPISMNTQTSFLAMNFGDAQLAALEAMSYSQVPVWVPKSESA